MKNRKHGWNRLTRWEYVWRRDEGICVYCGNEGQEVDHVLSRSQGGPDIPGNVVFSCHSCNLQKRGTHERYIAIGFAHLMSVGESLDWVDRFIQYEQKS